MVCDCIKPALNPFLSEPTYLALQGEVVDLIYNAAALSIGGKR
jgi:hypothetical protein